MFYTIIRCIGVAVVVCTALVSIAISIWYAVLDFVRGVNNCNIDLDTARKTMYEVGFALLASMLLVAYFSISLEFTKTFIVEGSKVCIWVFLVNLIISGYITAKYYLAYKKITNDMAKK